MNQTGVNTQTVADITNKVPTFAELIGYETKLADDNALIGNLNISPLQQSMRLLKQQLKMQVRGSCWLKRHGTVTAFTRQLKCQ
ncbi:hypothetical protein THIOSC15_3450011 [uncultured Thiomicrorhabdus sp.]